MTCTVAPTVAGPNSPEGKAQARQNSLKHGLAGAGTVLPADMAAALEARIAAWAERFRPADDYEAYLVRTAALASMRLDRLAALEFEGLAHAARRAEAGWEADGELAAEELGDDLARHPAVVAVALSGGRPGRVAEAY